MNNFLRKSLKSKIAFAGILIASGLTILPLMSSAQQAPEPWTGNVPGDNFSFASNDQLRSIRDMLNNNDINGAVNSAKRYVSSLERFERSGQTSQYKYDAYNALCIGLTAQKNYDEAREACDNAIKDSPNRWFAYNSRGSLNFRSGNYADAIKDYNLALERAPNTGHIVEILEHNINLAQSKN